MGCWFSFVLLFGRHFVSSTKRQMRICSVVSEADFRGSPSLHGQKATSFVKVRFDELELAPPPPPPSWLFLLESSHIHAFLFLSSSSSLATDFMYLTGFNEPDSALVLGSFFFLRVRPSSRRSSPFSSLLFSVRDSSSRGYKMTMFVPSRTASSDLWDGGKTGQEGAVEFFKADEVRLVSPPSHASFSSH